MIPYGRHSINQADIDAIIEVLRDFNSSRPDDVPRRQVADDHRPSHDPFSCWISIDQGVAFMLSSLAMMTGGEIFVSKIPSNLHPACRKGSSESGRVKSLTR